MVGDGIESLVLMSRYICYYRVSCFTNCSKGEVQFDVKAEAGWARNCSFRGYISQTMCEILLVNSWSSYLSITRGERWEILRVTMDLEGGIYSRHVYHPV